MKDTLKRIVLGTAIVGTLLSAGCNKETYLSLPIGEYKGYALCLPKVTDVDEDGKVDVLVNLEREKIPNLNFNLKTRNLQYKRIFIRKGYLARYAGEDVQVVSEDFFDEMFPIRKQPR